MRVLIADDDPDIRALHAQALALAGHQAMLAQDGVDAVRLWEMAAAGAIDAVLIDGHMPVVDGLSAIRQMRRMGNATVPIVLLTAYDYTPEEARRAGADLLLRKPISPMEVVERLEALVSRA